MSRKANVNQDVKDLIENIIRNYKLANDSNVTFNVASGLGDGFLSKTLAVSISDDNQSLELFLKSGVDIKPTPGMAIDKYFANEILFYEVIYPAYLKFVKEKNVEDGFRNISKCYGTSTKKIIALENLKEKGYTLCNKKKPLNDEHLRLVLETYAKFHAISFAYRDQRREEYYELIEPTKNVLNDSKEEGIEIVFRNHINLFLASLDPIEDKHILDRTDDLGNKLVKVAKEAFGEIADDSILTHGDCWCNNVMFLYEGENKEHPADIILVDWQITRPCLPVIDVSYFFYAVASQEALDNYKEYLKVYHQELSRQIKKLGSDPDMLYPFSLMQKQWKEKAKFGLYMAFLLIRIMLSEEDETLDFATMEIKNADLNEMIPTIKNYDEYISRIKMLTEHMIINDFL